MDFKKLLVYAKLVNHVCNEFFQAVNGHENEKIEKYYGALDNFNKWTKSKYLDSPNERLRSFRINQKGIREVIEITIVYLNGLRKIIKNIPETELTKLVDELEDFIALYKAHLPLRKYQNIKGNR